MEIDSKMVAQIASINEIKKIIRLRETNVRKKTIDNFEEK